MAFRVVNKKNGKVVRRFGTKRKANAFARRVNRLRKGRAFKVRRGK